MRNDATRAIVSGGKIYVCAVRDAKRPTEDVMPGVLFEPSPYIDDITKIVGAVETRIWCERGQQRRLEEACHG